ncbi:hypothetical protein NUH30_19475 [Leptospira sp. 85282-16]|uniref:Uncharacterized protein n=1 Tax=Leptospira montravelensis TaxID=2484961 RepID=A0ABY2LP65_9LEPT|nr:MULTISPECIES: hypothetical protein [Leptospira]MCT8335877.1 hypothetical protein [Leptospira sp. 85282-16]TGK82693.1 hypothetical protein EHQ19_08420 [Leptospira montravelensis]TGK94998.1 hypothetical protein EHQ31_18720 [Leptospira montravelensis]
MLKLAKKEDWDIKQLVQAYSNCIQKNITYHFFIKNKKVLSPNKKFKIALWCEWDLDFVKLYWTLFDKFENEISRKLITKNEPHFGEFVYYLSWKWINDKTIIIENKYKYSKNENWIISIS